MILVLVMTACNTVQEKVTQEIVEQQIKANNADVDVKSNGEKYEATYESEEGTVKVTGNQGSGEWCDEGADWSWISEGQNQATASWEVEGIVPSGEYAGHCHIKYQSSTEQGSTSMNYYINEDKSSGFLVMTLPNGQEYKQQWSQ